MVPFLVVLHVLISVSLVLVVLMQSSKGDGMAGTAFGGSMGGAVFGGRGAGTFLSKATTWLAVFFMVNCGALAFVSAQRDAPINADPTATTTSPVTEVAQEVAQEEQARQQALEQQRIQDSIARAAAAGNDGAIDVAPVQPSDDDGGQQSDGNQ